MTSPAKLLKQCRDKLAETQKILTVLEERVAEIEYQNAAATKRPAEAATAKPLEEAATAVPPVSGESDPS